MAHFEGDKLAGNAKLNENLSKCPRCGHKVSATANKQNKCSKRSKFVECCNAKVREDGPGRADGKGGRACRTDVAPVYKLGCCGPWPGHEMAEDEEDPKLVAKLDGRRFT